MMSRCPHWSVDILSTVRCRDVRASRLHRKMSRCVRCLVFNPAHLVSRDVKMSRCAVRVMVFLYKMLRCVRCLVSLRRTWCREMSRCPCVALLHKMLRCLSCLLFLRHTWSRDMSRCEDVEDVEAVWISNTPNQTATLNVCGGSSSV